MFTKLIHIQSSLELTLRDTTTVARLDVRLVLLVAVAACWSSAHGDEFFLQMEKVK